MNLDDTIVAIATPPGRGGIGVVRLSGTQAEDIANAMLALRRPLQAGRALFGELRDEHGERIDEVVATFFAKPHSYTADDVVEIAAHGSPVVLQHILERSLAAGARMAEPGEFTMRAFLNGRIDLTQAEAVNDLIQSQTMFQARQAAMQLDGALSKQIAPLKQRLLELIAALEAGIDFAEDDVAVMAAEQITQRIAAISAPLQTLLASYAYGRIVKQGLRLAIVGPPNVGKSSLFNRLIDREHAIVTATPGTTRDLVSETISVAGIPITLIDTAGIRATTEEAESIGIRKSLEALAEADVVVVVADATAPDEAQITELLARTESRGRILVANKSDLTASGRKDFLATSAVTGAGIDELKQKILALAGSGHTTHDGALLSNLRQQTAVRESVEALSNAKTAVGERIPHEMLLLDLYGAMRALDSLTGQTTADDVLNHIFSTFCIGK